MICQGDELVGVRCHCGMPTISAGLQDQHTHLAHLNGPHPLHLNDNTTMIEDETIAPRVTVPRA